MNMILSIAIGLGVWFATASIVWAGSQSQGLSWILGILFGILAGNMSYKKFNGAPILDTGNDAEYYAKVEQEIKDGLINDGLWSQALVEANGDEQLRKIEYMKLRVKQMKK